MPMSNVTMDEKMDKNEAVYRQKPQKSLDLMRQNQKLNQNPENFPSARVEAPYSTPNLQDFLNSMNTVIFYYLLFPSAI